jgi:NitT/TauT family transport system substrate-binding protein
MKARNGGWARFRSLSWTAACCVTAALLATACGSAGGSAGRPASSRAAGTAASPAQTAPVPTATPSAAALKTVTIALGSIGSASNSALYTADGLGYFRSEGIRMQYTQLSSASEATAVLVGGRTDVAEVGFNPALFNSVAHGAHFRVVADKASLPKGFGYLQILVRSDLAGAIRGPADLRGRSIAMTPPGLGTATGYSLTVYLAKAHLTTADVHIQPIAFASQVAALQNHAVDAAIEVEPFATKAIQAGIAKRLVTLAHIVPGQEIGGLAYSDQFMAQHPGLAQKFMVAYIRGARAYYAAFEHGTDKARIIGILAAHTSVKNTKLWASMIPAGINPNGTVNLASVKQQEDFFHSIGMVKQEPPLSSFIDNAFAAKADQILGPAAGATGA